MKYLSLFSGIGGFELGIQQDYESNNEYAHISKESKQKKRPQGREWPADKHRVLLHTGDWSAPLCVGYSEIDKYASQIYQRHFPEHKNYGDIKTISADSLPDFDLICGGFPCQSFSIAGKRRGFEDTRGTLFFDIARILKAKQPRLLFLENVKGLLSHDTGRTFRTIIATLNELGYDLQWQVLNSKNFGVPQNRERVFIIGHLRGTPRPEVFPFGGSNNEDKESVTATAIDANYWKGVDNHGQRTMVYWKNSKEKWVKENRSYTPVLKTQSDYVRQTLLDGIQIRRLTPKECERLQGFPDGWTEGVSDTQRYKCLGNAVSVPVIKAITEKLCLNA